MTRAIASLHRHQGDAEAGVSFAVVRTPLAWRWLGRDRRHPAPRGDRGHTTVSARDRMWIVLQIANGEAERIGHDRSALRPIVDRLERLCRTSMALEMRGTGAGQSPFR